MVIEFKDGGNTEVCPYEVWGDFGAECLWENLTNEAIARGALTEGNQLSSIDLKWRSPIYMPLAVARITLRVINVWVERLQDISAQDACAEGWPGEILKCCGDGCMYDGTNKRDVILAGGLDDDAPIEWFADTWNPINKGRPSHCWDANPWVWVVEFEKVKP